MDEIPKHIWSKIGIDKLRPVQEKAIKQGLFTGKNLVICSPTASGKTLIAEMAILNIISLGKKAVYIVPLRALASEKYKEFKEKYDFKIAVSTGDFDSDDNYLSIYDLIITTSEKMDSLLRHRSEWIKDIGLLIIDEIHLINDSERGPVLEMVITLLKKLLNPQIIALSATIGNPETLADWLDAELVVDNWRPVKLKHGILNGDKIEFY